MPDLFGNPEPMKTPNLFGALPIGGPAPTFEPIPPLPQQPAPERRRDAGGQRRGSDAYRAWLARPWAATTPADKRIAAKFKETGQTPEMF
jgi:hypothetical protein